MRCLVRRLALALEHGRGWLVVIRGVEGATGADVLCVTTPLMAQKV